MSAAMCAVFQKVYMPVANPSIAECGMYPVDCEDQLIGDVHTVLQPPTEDGKSFLARGPYKYYHYKCDGVNDNGWGCGYRTCQTLCSWVTEQLLASRQVPRVPSLRQIQDILVGLEDKPSQFAGSRDWIGSVEVCLVLDHLYGTPCKILHSNRGQITKQTNKLIEHFRDFGSPVMMGGDLDCSSKGILGVHVCDSCTYLLVVDPHFSGRAATRRELQSGGWVKWQHLSEFVDSSFYNLCLPQLRGRS